MMSLTENERDLLNYFVEKILAYKREKNYKLAIKEATNFTTKFPKKATPFGLLGSLYFELNDYYNAKINFEIATKISPRSETASLGLFHSLWGIGEKKQALDELNRFTSISESDEHNKLIEEIKKQDNEKE
jgi:tetratricopeptide (TPR) repeat protein